MKLISVFSLQTLKKHYRLAALPIGIIRQCQWHHLFYPSIGLKKNPFADVWSTGWSRCPGYGWYRLRSIRWILKIHHFPNLELGPENTFFIKYWFGRNTYILLTKCIPQMISIEKHTSLRQTRSNVRSLRAHQ